jgi:hypothetical protein
VDRRQLLLTSQFVAPIVAAYFSAGCGGVSASTTWQTQCPQGNYAPQSLDEWFRASAEVTRGRHGPQVEGYIYNNYFAGAEQMLVAVEQLSPSGQAVSCATVWVTGSVPPGNRAYFATPVPDASAKYRVRVLSFNWEKRGGQ